MTISHALVELHIPHTCTLLCGEMAHVCMSCRIIHHTSHIQIKCSFYGQEHCTIHSHGTVFHILGGDHYRMFVFYIYQQYIICMPFQNFSMLLPPLPHQSIQVPMPVFVYNLSYSPLCNLTLSTSTIVVALLHAI
jgi:hypothetical protein